MPEIVTAEFDSPERLVRAALRLRALGYARLDAFSPFPIPALDEALAIRRTKIPYLVFVAACAGAAIALAIQWWTNAIDYPINVGARPTNSLPTHVLIVFETTVLFGSFAAFAAVLLGSKLPRLYDPIFDLPGVERTSVDRFLITIGDAYAASKDVRDEELAVLEGELSRLGALAIHGLVREGRR